MGVILRVQLLIWYGGAVDNLSFVADGNVRFDAQSDAYLQQRVMGSICLVVSLTCKAAGTRARSRRRQDRRCGHNDSA